MKTRGYILFFLFLWGFIGIGGRLAYLCLGDTLMQTAEGQSSYLVTVDEPRGTVFDRTLEPITNRDWVVKTGVLPPSLETDGVGVSCRQGFSTLQTAAHLIGYVDSTENKGVGGLQHGYDSLLQGTPTTVTYYRDAVGGILQGLGTEISQDLSIYEKGVVTTLWLPLQQAVEKAFSSSQKGAVVITHCQTGEVLAGASFPSFSPLDVSASFDNTASPLLNRMLLGYNVGSVFKLCVAAAALEQGISSDYTYCCTGEIQAGQSFSCHKAEGHGTLNMEQALAVSCNPYFIHLASRVGGQGVYDMAVAMGLGEETTLCQGITGEKGELPVLEELLRSPAELANFAIGQGRFLATPLQINGVTAALANGGVMFPQRLVSGLRNTKGEVTYEKGKTGKRVCSVTTAETLKTMMATVMTGGTGTQGYFSELPSGGKTSTAQTGMVDRKGQGVYNAWFTGFLPLENPIYAVTVLVEGGSSGGSDAAPIFREICKTIYYEGLLRE